MNYPMRLRKRPLSILSAKKYLKKGKRFVVSSKCKKCTCGYISSKNGTFEFPAIWEELRVNKQLCDGIVRCEDGVIYHIHRIILSAISPYFRALFTNSINRGQPEISEANVSISSDAFKVVLDFAYTGSCVINKSNVYEVLKYADQYEILDVVQKCCEFLVNELSPTNCLQIFQFAKQYFCKFLVQKGNMFVLQNFSDVLETNEEFCNVSVQQLKEILSDDYLNVKSEEVALEAIKRWIEFSPNNRKKHLVDFLKCIRMGNLSYDKIVKFARWSFIEEDTAATLYIADVLMILEDFVHIEIECLNTYLIRPRIPYDILFAVGGWSAGSPTSFVETYDNRADKWLVSKDTDVVPRAYHGMCSYDNKIYLVGGFDGNEYFNTVRRFDPVTHTWKDCACMYYSRCYVSVVYCAGKIYAMGGYNGRIRMNSAERFDPVKNQWELMPSMQKQRSDASAATLSDKVYIVGGFNGQEVMNSCEMYDPITNQWSFIPSMISARSGVSLIAFKNTLYALGGFNGYTRLPSSEKFTPDISSGWAEVAEMMTPRSNFGTVILDDYVYVIGGFDGSTTINYVEYYDADTDEWFDAASMNLNRSALSACVISGLPNSKDYSYLDRSQKHQNDDVKA